MRFSVDFVAIAGQFCRSLGDLQRPTDLQSGGTGVLLGTLDVLSERDHLAVVDDEVAVLLHGAEHRGEVAAAPLSPRALELQIPLFHGATVALESLEDELLDLAVDRDAPGWQPALDSFPHPVQDRDG